MRKYLWCPVCQGEYSATPGDYFLARDETVFECCGELNVLCATGGRFTGDSILSEIDQPVTVGQLRNA